MNFPGCGTYTINFPGCGTYNKLSRVCYLQYTVQGVVPTKNCPWCGTFNKLSMSRVWYLLLLEPRLHLLFHHLSDGESAIWITSTSAEKAITKLVPNSILYRNLYKNQNAPVMTDIISDSL